MADRVTFNDENMERQYFYLPYPVTQHILWNANAEILNKLYKTCKYFYKKRSYCIVDEMKMSNYAGRSMKIGGNVFGFDGAAAMEMMDNFWITKKLEGIDQKMISKIAKCDAEEIRFIIPSLSFNDFITLTKSGNVTFWNSFFTSITDGHGNLLSFEKLLFYLPNATVVGSFVPNRFEILGLSCPNHSFNADVFFDFLKKTLAPNARVALLLNDEDAVENFKTQMDAKLNSWIPQNEKPDVFVLFYSHM